MDYGLKVFVLILAGHFGLLAHYLKSYLRSQTKEPLVRYFFVANVRATAQTYLTFVVAMVGLLTQIESGTNVLIFATSFMAGFSINSALNSDTDTGDNSAKA